MRLPSGSVPPSGCDEAPRGHAGEDLRHGVGLDHPDPRRRLERREIFGGLPDLGIADDLEHRDHRAAVLAVAGLPVVHRANEVAGRQAGHVAGFVGWPVPVGRWQEPQARTFVSLVAELDDLRHRRMHVRTPVRNVVEVVDGGAGVRHALPTVRTRSGAKRWATFTLSGTGNAHSGFCCCADASAGTNAIARMQTIRRMSDLPLMPARFVAGRLCRKAIKIAARPQAGRAAGNRRAQI